MGHLHDLIRTVIHGITAELGYARPGDVLHAGVLFDGCLPPTPRSLLAWLVQ
ncbi:hypothetical protein ACFXPJ_00475 [Streptomyces goshikiensis]